MASATVKLMSGSSFSGCGHRFKRGETKVITSASDIAYFKANSRFRVKIVKGVAPPKTEPESKPPPAAEPEDNVDGGDGPLPWTKAMKKAELLDAANSRDIAVTPEDRVADIVQLLTEWDEEHGGE